MLLRKYAATLGFLFMVGLLVSHCVSQVSFIRTMTSNATQSPNFYKELMTVASNQDAVYDKNGNLSQDILENKDTNELYDVTNKFRTAVAVVTPTSLSAQIPFAIYVQHTTLYHYLQHVDVWFQSGIIVVLKKMDKSTAAPKPQQS